MQSSVFLTLFQKRCSDGRIIRLPALVRAFEPVEPIANILDHALFDTHWQLRSTDMSLLEKDAAHLCPTQICLFQMSALHMGFTEIGSL